MNSHFHVKQAEKASAPSAKSSVSPPRLLAGSMMAGLVFGMTICLAGCDEGSGTSTDTETGRATTAPSGNGNTSSPTQAPEVGLDSDRVKRALMQEVTISKTIAVRRQGRGPVNRDLVYWLDLTSVSIRSGTEVGYEYDIVISYKWEAGIMSGEQLSEMQDSSPCMLTLHVSNDYRVADNFSIQGEMAITEHADYIANVIEQLGR